MPYIPLFILAIIDIVAGIFLYFHPSFLYRPYLWLSVICLIKGGWSLVTSAAHRFYFDLLGLLDVVVGISLLLFYNNVTFPFFYIFGVAIILKGVWTMFFAVASN